MSRLQTTVNNIPFLSPFILASGPPTRSGERIAKAFKIGWDAAVTKTICLNYEQMIDVSPRIARVEGGLNNIEIISPISPEQWIEDIKSLKANFPQKVVIASIASEADNPESWQKLALAMQKAGADILELNFSCPHGLPAMKMGNTCSEVPELAANITKAVKEIAKIPVWVKLSPNVTNISALALLCENNGADGISAINTVKGFAGIDVEKRMPKMDINGYTTYGGISGSTIKPIALKATADIASAISCPISGIGGVSSWKDATEFILLGASTVQICTAVMLEGYSMINRLKEGMESYMQRNKISSLNSIKGTFLKKIKPHNSLKKTDRTVKLVPKINTDKCIKCGKCYKACQDSGYQAINVSPEGSPAINTNICTGCGLCTAVCPVAECIGFAHSVTTL